jgi:very-short-patch-repair endonuclease
MQAANNVNQWANRMAQANGGIMHTAQMGGSNNVTSTAPGFYSPYHTPSAWQIPTARKEVYAWCSYWYQNEPIVGSAIDFYSKFTMNGFTLDCDDSGIKEYFEELVEKLELQKWLVRIAHEYFLYGDAFVFLELDCPRCKGTGYDQDNGQFCDHCVSDDGEYPGAIWKSVSIFDPNTVQVQEDVVGSKDPEISMVPSERMIEICTKGEPKEVFDSIPDNVKNLIRSRRPIKLDNISVTHLKFGGSSYQPYGTSLIRRLFPVLAYRDKLRQAQWIIAERHILPVKIVTIGSPERPATADEINDAMEQLAVVANDPIQTIVAHDQFKMDWVGASGKVLQLTNEFDQIMQELQVGLQLNSALLQGEGPAYNSAQVGLEALAAKLNPIRDEFKTWIEQKIFKPVSKFNNFYQDDARGNTKSLVFPKIVWKDLPLKDRAQELQILLQLRARNEVSLETIHTKLNLDYDTEIEKLRMEDLGSALSSPDMGLGVTEGEDLGGGPVGGMGGGGGAPMPAEGADLAGGGGMEGAPGGMEGAPGGAPMPAPGGLEASLMMENYRQAMSSMRTVKASMIDDYSSNSRRTPVFGTSFRGDLPEDPYLETNPMYMPWGRSTTYGSILNRKGENLRNMMKIAGKGEDQVFTKKTYFTKPEQIMYKSVLSMNVGVPFYAQYVVGGNPNLRVDGAFPTIKLAIEADGETWHRGTDKQEKDRRRDVALQQQGWIVIRFTDREIEEKTDQVIEVIRRAIDSRLSSKQQG